MAVNILAKPSLMRTWGRFTLHAGVLAAVLYAYMRLIETAGGFSTAYLSQQLIEFALVLYLYAFIYVSMKPWRGRSVLAGLVLLLLYLIHDLFYLVYGKVFRLINISEFPELVQILPAGYTVLLFAVLTLPLGLFLIKFDYRRPGRLALWLSPLLIGVVAVKATPDAFARSFEQVAGIVKYSDGKSVENNGRLAMLAYHEAQRSSALEQLEPFYDRGGYEQQAKALAQELAAHNKRRNVHLVVLESFLDPRLFERLRFSSSPVHPSFEALFGDRLGLSISPVFGGATAQAEFELLCGVPALEKLSSVEFNIFSGAPAHCLPGTLADLGYRSVATNTYKPNFFNAIPAYQGAGFAESYFPQEYSPTGNSYLQVGEPGAEDYLFDGSLFAQNLEFVRRHLQQNPEQPLFNYIMTIYGHTPHVLNPGLRPEFIRLESDYPDDHLTRAVNQFYYRTEAIADYINKLLTMDKNSLIILVSDHVPPLRNGPNTYNALKYMGDDEDSYYYNRLAVLENGEAKVYPVLHHHELPPLILNYVSDGAYCRRHACTQTEHMSPAREQENRERYMRLMAHAAK